MSYTRVLGACVRNADAAAEVRLIFRISAPRYVLIVIVLGTVGEYGTKHSYKGPGIYMAQSWAFEGSFCPSMGSIRCVLRQHVGPLGPRVPRKSGEQQQPIMAVYPDPLSYTPKGPTWRFMVLTNNTCSWACNL